MFLQIQKGLDKVAVLSIYLHILMDWKLYFFIQRLHVEYIDTYGMI